MKLEEMRREYLKEKLTRDSLRDDPFAQFDYWLQQAVKSEIPDPTAMSIATVDAIGQPSQRLVLLKHIDTRGLVFFTNYGSAKARDIEGNQHVSLLFPWHMLERQVKIMGVAAKISTAESLSYFLTRPRESQLAAWASHQSQRISSRSALLAQFESMKQKFRHGDIPLPDFWGGYRVAPTSFEFWQGGANRLHDRFEYARSDDSWTIERLAP